VPDGSWEEDWDTVKAGDPPDANPESAVDDFEAGYAPLDTL